MAERRGFERSGVRLSVLDFGGEGPPVLLLHGLAGHAGEWLQTASWLTADHHVFALEARGHGHSERRPEDLSPAAQVADVAFILSQLTDPPVVLVGQSLGGVTAMLVAARHPCLVAGLAMVDAAAGSGGAGTQAADAIGRALRSWPVPFSSYAAGAEFFRGCFGEGAAVPWADGLEQSNDGWRPRFEVDVMKRTLGEMQEPSTWADWEAVACPVLIVRAERGVIEPEVAQEMVARRPGTRITVLSGARHDLHLDRPHAWREALTTFLATLDADGP